MLHTSLDDVTNHHIVESIVFPNVRYYDAEEHANPGSWQSGLTVSDPTDLAEKPDCNRFRIMMGIVIKC